MSRRTVLSLALCCGLVRSATADKLVDGLPIQAGIGIEVGAIMNTGMSEFGDDHADLAPSAQGLFIRDRNGMTSRMVIGLLIAVAGAMAASGPKSVESRSYTSGNYVITETKTTYYSEAEKAQMRENTSKAVDGLFAARYADFELDVADDLAHVDARRGQPSMARRCLGRDPEAPRGHRRHHRPDPSGFGFGSATSDRNMNPVNVRWIHDVVNDALLVAHAVLEPVPLVGQ